MNNENKNMDNFEENSNFQTNNNFYNVSQNQNLNTQTNFVNSSVNIIPEVTNMTNIDNSAINQSVNNQQLYNTTNFINDSDKPVERKNKKATIKINPELKFIILLALILLLAMSFIPTIFDWIEELKLKIF